MKEKIQILVFAAFVLLIASLFRYCSGPFYFGNNNDPSYFYFYNFLCILEGKSLPFVDHPGTTLDMLGALVVKMFFSSSQNTPWLLANALRSEEVLGLVWFLMIVMYVATVVVLGFYVFKKLQDRVFTGLVLLSSLWLIGVRSFSGQGILPISANVNSDTMMMTAVNLMLLAIFRFYFSPKTHACSQAISLGTAVAFALATKFTALPFFVVAWVILETWQQRILLTAVVAGGFIVLTCPLWSSYSHMITWCKGLIFHQGFHGSGGEGFDRTAFVRGFVWVIKTHWFFAGAWFFAGMVALNRRPSVDSKIRRVLSAVALGGLAQMIIVAKQPSYQYMAPMIGISSLVPAFLYKAFPHWWRRGFKYAMGFILAVSLGSIAVGMWQVNEKKQKTKEMLETIAKDYAQCRVCPFYRSSTPGFSFVFWNRVIESEEYSSILKSLYPDLVYYDIFGRDFKDSAGQVVSLGQLKRQKSQVLIYGSDRDPQSFEPYLTIKKIYTHGDESLYEVISGRSNRGMEFFQYAMVMFAQGRDEEAFKAAVISQQLGVGQDISGFIELLSHKILRH
ncbi:MAG: hypothetical protein HQL14_07275 [Candidatus Omnitrophica bacterium]|nr:hypothetical protein [Candidatus Omnitrophota bacterium]